MAGQTRTCPHCKNKVTIPQTRATKRSAAFAPDALLDPPLQLEPETTARSEGTQPVKAYAGVAEQGSDELLTSRGIEPQPRHSGPRARPRPLDILLYPVNVSGLIHLVILAFFAAQLRPALQPLYWLQPPIMHLALLVIGGGYSLFYLAGCIRDSTGGELRAPDVNRLPEQLSTDAILSQLIAMSAWAACCVGPLLVCVIVGRSDYLLWLLAAYAAIYAPIALLAVVMFDSVRALNPLLILPSIASVFAPYMLLALGSCLVSGLLVLLYPHFTLGGILCAYLLMVMAHVLGRFYLRYEDRLNWEA